MAEGVVLGGALGWQPRRFEKRVGGLEERMGGGRGRRAGVV